MRKRPAHTLIFTLAVLAVLFVITAAALSLVQFDQYIASRSYWVKQARSLAEAGVDHAIRQLNASSNYSGESGTALGQGVFTVTVSGSGPSRTIESYGYVPNATSPKAKRKIIVTATIDNTNAEFFYGIQVDGGGLLMANNSRVNGNVYSNGNIIGSPGATISGDAIVAGGISDTPSLQWITLNADQHFANSNDNRDIAQSFTAPASDQLNKVSVYLGKVGSPTNNLTLRIAEHNSSEDKPQATDIANGIIAASSVGSSPSWVDVSFGIPPTLTAGTKYWIILDTSSSSGVDYWNWRKDSSDGYANNTSKYTSNWSTGGASWTNINADLGFRVWVGGVQTRIDTMTIGDSTTGTGRANAFINSTIHGASCPNQYCIIDNPPQEPLPISEGVVQDWKDDAAVGGTHSGDYILDNFATASLGPRVINGNLSLNNGAILTMTGTLYVTGNITLANNCVVQLDPGYGTSSGVIITDGTVVISNNCAFSGAQSGSYVILLTTKDDKNNVSMTISNNSLGVIYYAGKTRISFANNAGAKEATAWGINLDNNAVITYESGLSNIFFSNGPGGGWTVKKGTWREVRNF